MPHAKKQIEYTVCSNCSEEHLDASNAGNCAACGLERCSSCASVVIRGYGINADSINVEEDRSLICATCQEDGKMATWKTNTTAEVKAGLAKHAVAPKAVAEVIE